MGGRFAGGAVAWVLERAGHRVRSACRLALYDDLGADSRDSADHHPAIPPRTAPLERKENGWHAKAAKCRRAVCTAIAAHDRDHDHHVRAELWRRIWRDSADAAD